MTTISQPVGIRNGVAMLPNQAADLRTITELLDRIPTANGGTAATPRLWSADRNALIVQVAAAIIVFQTANRRPKIDGAVDPGGGTLRRMDELAGPQSLSATVSHGDTNSSRWVVADAGSLDGTAPLVARSIAPTITRKLIRVTGTSIHWFGVVLPLTDTGSVIGGSPHLFFTPSPWQGNYYDPGYETFATWRDLWDKYTSAIGSQLVASGAPQILVIPFYKNSQAGALGEFLGNWKATVSAVVSAAINSVDPLFLRDTYEFDEIYSSSFSNGIATLQNFHARATDAADMTRLSFDLDGQASGSNWRANRSVVYANTRPPAGGNPSGSRWHVGGRMGALRPSYPGASDHNICPFLLLHGLTRFGR